MYMLFKNCARYNKCNYDIYMLFEILNKMSDKFHDKCMFVKGRPEPSILDDLCLGNVMSQYFRKLRFGTSKMQLEPKCLENIFLSVYESLLRALRTRVV